MNLPSFHLLGDAFFMAGTGVCSIPARRKVLGREHECRTAVTLFNGTNLTQRVHSGSDLSKLSPLTYRVFAELTRSTISSSSTCRVFSFKQLKATAEQHAFNKAVFKI